MANISLKQGDDAAIPLTITDAAGMAVSIANATLTCHLRKRGAASDLITPTLTHVNDPAGQARLDLSAAQTTNLPGDTVLVYEVEMLDGAGKTSTPVEGYCWVEADRG